MNLESLSYELGVMMFNVANRTDTGGYDLKGNFESIAEIVGEQIVKGKVYSGFISESDNHNTKDTENLMELFDKKFSEYWDK